MSRSDRSFTRIGCPECESPVDATVPQGPGIESPTVAESTRLRGKVTACGRCGHQLAVYYY